MSKHKVRLDVIRNAFIQTRTMNTCVPVYSAVPNGEAHGNGIGANVIGIS
jgi:hypothetical protein